MEHRSTRTAAGVVVDMEATERARISVQKSKEALAIAMALHQRVGLTVCVATDGSHEPRGAEPGDESDAATAWGAWDGDTAIGGALPPESGNYHAELVAVEQVLRRQAAGARVLIVSDGRSALQAIRRVWLEGETTRLRQRTEGLLLERIVNEMVRVMAAGVGEVLYMFVPAHGGGVAPNAYADAIAKSHLSERPTGGRQAIDTTRMVAYKDAGNGELRDAHVYRMVRDRVGATGTAASGDTHWWQYVRRSTAAGGGAGTARRPSKAGRAMQMRALTDGTLGYDDGEGEGVRRCGGDCDAAGGQADMLHVVTCECDRFTDEERAQQRQRLEAAIQGVAAAMPTPDGNPAEDTAAAWRAGRNGRAQVRAKDAGEETQFTFAAARAGQCGAGQVRHVTPGSE